MNSTFGAIGKATTDKLTETVDGKTSSFGFMYQSIPKPPIPPPGHLTRVKLHIVGNLTQNEAPPVGHLTFVSKRLLAVGSKRIIMSQLNSLIRHVRRVHGSLLLSISRGFFCCCRFMLLYLGIGHFTVVCPVTWPSNGNEAGGDIVLIQTSLLLLCKSSYSDAN